MLVLSCLIPGAVHHSVSSVQRDCGNEKRSYRHILSCSKFIFVYDREGKYDTSWTKIIEWKCISVLPECRSQNSTQNKCSRRTINPSANNQGGHIETADKHTMQPFSHVPLVLPADPTLIDVLDVTSQYAIVEKIYLGD